MKRKTFARDLLGTLLMFLALIVFVIVIILGENFLDRFKAH